MVVYDISKKKLLQFVAIQIKKMKSAAASYTFQVSYPLNPSEVKPRKYLVLV